jgi:hypothetical protein
MICHAERLVGRDRRVLPVAVAGIEEIELVVLRALMPDLTAIQDHTLLSIPRLEPDTRFEGLQVGSDPAPALALLFPRASTTTDW